MTTVNDIIMYIESIAPTALKMDWDNVGLLCGSRSTPVTTVLVALDPFENVCREAAELGAELIVTHHPLIFQPAEAITDDTSVGRSVLFLASHGISAANAHTNLDRAAGGVNDVLAQTLGLQNIQVIDPDGEGLLRKGNVSGQTLEQFLSHVKDRLSCPGLRYVSGGRPVRMVAVGGGSCGSELYAAVNAGCDTFVTADVKYNQFQEAAGLGINLIDAGHFYTENPVVAVLAEKIAAAFPEITVKTSKSNTDPMKFY